MTGHEPLDASRVVEEHRCDELLPSQHVVAALEDRLVLVDDKTASLTNRGLWHARPGFGSVRAGSP